MSKDNKITSMQQSSALDTAIEKLAAMVAKGFANTATKDDLRNVETGLKTDLAAVERRLSNKIEAINEKIDTLEEADEKRVFGLEKDMKYIK